MIAKQRGEARVLAETLPRETATSSQLERLLHIRTLAALSYLSSLMTVAVLVQTVWKPGA